METLKMVFKGQKMVERQMREHLRSYIYHGKSHNNKQKIEFKKSKLMNSYQSTFCCLNVNEERSVLHNFVSVARSKHNNFVNKS